MSPGALVPYRQMVARASSGALPKYVRRDEAQRALTLLEGDDLGKRKAHAFLRCMWELGARPSEMIVLRVGDIDFLLGTINVITLKKRTPKGRPKPPPPPRVIPAKEGLRQELAALLNDLGRHKSEERVWDWERCYAARVCRQALLAAGVESARANPRALRHGFGVNCITQNVPPNVLQEWMGHSSLLITSIYTRIAARDTQQWHDGVEF